MKHLGMVNIIIVRETDRLERIDKLIKAVWDRRHCDITNLLEQTATPTMTH